MKKVDITDEVKEIQQQKEEIKTFEDALELAKTEVRDLRENTKITNMFIVKLKTQNISLKLDLGRRLTLDEIDFLRKSCI